MNLTKKQKWAFIYFNTLLSLIVFYYLYNVGFVSMSTLEHIYIPIWVLSILPMLYSRVLFGTIFIVGANIGAISEYLITISNTHYINISGSFCNTLILVISFALGLLVQFGYYLIVRN